MADDLFVRLPHWIIRDAALDRNELLLYIAMLSRSDKRGICWPSVATLAREARMSESTVRRTRDRLEQRGFVKVTRRRREGRRDQSNLYKVVIPTKAESARHGLHGDTLPAVDNPLGSRPMGVTVTGDGCHSDTLPPVTVTGEVDTEEVDPGKKIPTPELRAVQARSGFSFAEDRATPAQLRLIKDLWIHVTAEIPPERHEVAWAEMTQEQTQDYIRRCYRNVQHHDGYEGPEEGTPEYEALSADGKAWADAGMVPDQLAA